MIRWNPENNRIYRNHEIVLVNVVTYINLLKANMNSDMLLQTAAIFILAKLDRVLARWMS